MSAEEIKELAFWVPFLIIVGIGAGIIVLAMFGITLGKGD